MMSTIQGKQLVRNLNSRDSRNRQAKTSPYQLEHIFFIHHSCHFQVYPFHILIQ